ncbi:hypothetical protein BU24DRAFT_323263, partial [Aaosphaeria arxii CBS 175.79]
AIKGPGFLWVTSRISKSAADILDESTYFKWYDEDHIAEIIATSSIKSGFRYVNVEKESHHGSPRAPMPFLAFYPMDDLAFMQGPEFKNIRVKSDILPGSGIIYDFADVDVRYLGLVGQSGKKQGKAAQYLIVSAIEPATGTSDEDVDAFFDQQINTVSKTPNYVRTLRLKLLYARTNAQSRALKGLPTTDEPAPEPPTWQVVHEFSAEPSAEAKRSIQDDRSPILKTAKQIELHVYKLTKAH